MEDAKAVSAVSDCAPYPNKSDVCVVNVRDDADDPVVIQVIESKDVEGTIDEHEPREDPSKTRVCMGEAKQKGGNNSRAMEDIAFAFQTEDGRIRVGAIFDGHGEANGRLAAIAGRDVLFQLLNSNQTRLSGWSLHEWNEALGKVFDDMQAMISFRLCGGPGPRSPPPSGGSTSSIIVELSSHGPSQERLVICANVGDSFGALLPLDEDKNPGYTRRT